MTFDSTLDPDLVSDLTQATLTAAAAYEFSTFLLGSRLPDALDPEIAREHKRALHAALASAVVRSRPGTSPDFANPDVRLLVDVARRAATVQARSTWIAGRYRKLDREIPQSRWPCVRCKGSGCERCLGTGKIYAESVEEAIGGPAVRAFGGTGTRFHAVGREDIDAQMLGSGRPFVLEVLEPHRRRIEPEALAREANEAHRGRVEVVEIRLAEEGDALAAKSLECEKSYRVEIVGSRPLDDSDAARVAELSGVELRQETPNRVLHRRGDAARRRRVFRSEATVVRGGLLEARFRVQSGTYVKELVSGDGGRTMPSLASLLGCRCRVLTLDVMEVHDRPSSA